MRTFISRYFHFLLTVATSVNHISCDRRVNTSESVIVVKRMPCPSLLLYVGTDVKFESSALYALNPCNGRETLVLPQQSSDSVLLGTAKRMFLVNRSAQHQSLREVFLRTTTATIEIELGHEWSLAKLKSGDPQVVEALSSDRLILGNFVEGSLAELDLNTGEITSFDTSAVAEHLRPVGLWYAADLNRFMVLHQGFDSSYQLDQSQSVLSFPVNSPRGDRANLVSDSSFRSLLRTSLPDGWAFDNGRLYSLALCGKIHSDCQSGIESFDVSQQQMDEPKRIDQQDVFYYGRSVYAKRRRAFFAPTIDAHGRKILREFHVATGTQRVILEFANEPISGYWPSFFDEEQDTLMVADAKSSRTGSLTILSPHKPRKIFSLKAIPSSGLVYSFADH